MNKISVVAATKKVEEYLHKLGIDVSTSQIDISENTLPKDWKIHFKKDDFDDLDLEPIPNGMRFGLEFIICDNFGVPRIVGYGLEPYVLNEEHFLRRLSVIDDRTTNEYGGEFRIGAALEDMYNIDTYPLDLSINIQYCERFQSLPGESHIKNELKDATRSILTRHLHSLAKERWGDEYLDPFGLRDYQKPL